MPRKALLLTMVLASSFPLAPRVEADFRQDEFGDRDFEYNALYFLHRLSFQQDLEWRRHFREKVEIPDDGKGYRIEVGSVRSDEFLLFQEARLGTKPADWVQLWVRYYEGEDYDARFSRLLVGGRFFSPWWGLHLGVFTELDAFKEDIDIGFGLGWRSPEREVELELQWVLVDALFNEKADSGRYSTKARTVRTLLRLQPSETLYGELALEVDLPLELRLPDEVAPFRYRRRVLRTSGLVELDLSERDILALYGRQEHATERQVFLDPADATRSSRIYRDAFELTLAWRRRIGAADALETGVRGSYLNEFLERPLNPGDSRQLLRRELFAYLTYRWSLRNYVDDGVFLRPSLYLGYFEDRELFTIERADEGDAGFAGKLGLGVEYHWDEDHRVLLNATVEIERSDFLFGGANVQFLMTF